VYVGLSGELPIPNSFIKQTSYSSDDVNQMWILQKIYKDLLEYIESRSLFTFTSSSLSERLESQIIKTICVQVADKMDLHIWKDVS
jgi:hypothetical protein